MRPSPVPVFRTCPVVPFMCQSESAVHERGPGKPTSSPGSLIRCATYNKEDFGVCGGDVLSRTMRRVSISFRSTVREPEATWSRRIGEVRDMGFIIDVGFATSGIATLVPDVADTVHERARRRSLLTGRNGPSRNVLRIAPLVCVSLAEVDEAPDILLVSFGVSTDDGWGSTQVSTRRGRPRIFLPNWLQNRTIEHRSAIDDRSAGPESRRCTSVAELGAASTKETERNGGVEHEGRYSTRS